MRPGTRKNSNGSLLGGTNSMPATLSSGLHSNEQSPSTLLAINFVPLNQPFRYFGSPQVLGKSRLAGELARREPWKIRGELARRLNESPHFRKSCGEPLFSSRLDPITSCVGGPYDSP